MFNEIRYAIRTFRQNPGFALTAIVSIALAIGANSAIFSFQDGLLLRPLAVKNPSTLVTVNSRTPEGYFGGFSYADVVDLRDKNRSFDGLVAYRMIPAGIARDPNAQLQFKAGMLVTGNFFELLGVQPYLGRGFHSDEDSVPGRDAVVMLAYDFWHNEFGADPSIVGRRIRIGRAGGTDFTVIGVTPESFTGMDLLLRPTFFIPVMMGPRVLGVGDEMLTERTRLSREDSFYVKARLKRGASIQAASADVSTLERAIEAAYPETQRGRGAAVRTEFQSRLDATPVLGGVVAAVSGVMIVILLIACANVMNLMLGRGRARSREIAIRFSLGAGRLRLIRQLMVESFIIAMTGAALGLLFAQAGVAFFSSWELPGDVPGRFVFQLDERVLVFTLIVSVASAILFGLAPAMGSTRANLITALRAGQSSDGPKRRLFGRHMLVGIQITGSIVLVVTAVQMYRNTMKALTANPGFTTDHRLTLRLDPEVAGYNLAQAQQFYTTLVERAPRVPGVKSAALSAGLPFTTEALVYNVTPEGYDFGAGPKTVTVRADSVDDHYFETFGVPILRGRAFLPSDQADSPKVAIINDALAQRFFGGNALGKHVELETAAGVRASAEVVGVAMTGKYQAVSEPPQPFVFVPFNQRPAQRMTLIVETSGDPAEAAGPLRELVRSIDRNVPIFAVRTMDDVFQRNAAAIINIFNAVFSATALMGFFLAVVGLYAIVAYQVVRRTREIGIRMALGAERLQIVKMMIKQASTIAVAATLIGLAISVVVRPLLLTSIGRRAEGGLLSGFDPLLFVLLPAALLLVTLCAAAIPARRASRIDPQTALRQD